MQIRLHSILLASSAVLLTFDPSLVHAQVAEPIGLEEVVVTAQRRTENLQRAAVAVSAVTGAQLVNAGVTETANLSRLVPALVVQPNGGSSTNFYLRGVGSYATNAFAENAVAFNFAGVYIARPTSPIGAFFDLERIEVVKGPQGTLYGRNATGGAINVLPRRPALGEFGGDVSAELGNYASKKASGALNLPLGEQAALRVAAQVVDRDAYLSDGYGDEQGQAVRASILWKPTDRLSALVMADWFHQGGRGVGSVLVPDAVVPTAPSPEDFIGGADPRSVAELRRRFPVPVNAGLALTPRTNGFVDSSFFGLTGVLEADLGFGALTVIPAYRRSEPDYLSYNLGYLADVTEKDDQYSLEVRLASPEDRALRYVAGLFYFREEQQADNFFSQGLATSTQFLPQLETESYAVFGQATYALNDRLRLVAGARYTREEKSQDTPLRQLSPVNQNPPFGLVTGDLDFEKVTWKAGVEYDAGDNSLIYANVATGFKAGGFFISFIDNSFEPEELTAYTLGSKNRFFDNRLQLNVEAFHWSYKDQQIGFVGSIQTRPGVIGTGLRTVNAGDAKMTGFEAELEWLATADDRLSANVQFLDSEYERFAYTAISANGLPPRTSCAARATNTTPATPPAAAYLIDCGGKPLINAPRWSVNLGYEHTFRLNGGLELVAGARSRLETSRYLGIDYLPAQRQASYSTSDLYLTLQSSETRWALTGFVNNVEDTVIYASSAQRAVIPVVYNGLRPPRTYGVRASYNF